MTDSRAEEEDGGWEGKIDTFELVLLMLEAISMNTGTRTIGRKKSHLWVLVMKARQQSHMVHICWMVVSRRIF